MKYSTDWLKQQIEKGVTPDYLFFWGHTPNKAGEIDKSCFSQWYPSAFVVNNVKYHTAEHWMMAKKALLFNDEATHAEILSAHKPAVAKALGRKVKPFDAEVWAKQAYDLVVEGNLHKYSQHASLKTFLLGTGNKIIVEASPVDFIWGIGLSKDAPDAMNVFKWKGTNWLGFALMEVRDQLLNLQS